MNKVLELIKKEQNRQKSEICLIASENYMSQDVLNACGSVLINKYSEGRPNINVSDNDDKEVYVYDESEYNRYYGGCRYIDEIEKIAIENVCKLFKCKYANVQPNSGCQANQAVYMALLKPNDTILAMDINSGAHISHSLPSGFAGKYHNVVTYGLDDNGYINYEEIREKLYSEKPRLLIVGASAYPRIIDFERIRSIVDDYNQSVYYDYGGSNNSNAPIKSCYLMVDMAHVAGLVSTGLHPSPLPYADVVTSTVQKTLRSGRGGIVLTNDKDIAKKIDSAVFPKLQGGPLNNMIAGKAIGFEEALQPEFKKYQEQVLKNVQAMVEVFNECGIKLITGGSDNHLILIDLREENFSGKDLETVLEKQGIITNKNAVQGDTRPKTETSGLRIGTACITTRGAIEDDAHQIALYIAANIDYLRNHGGVPDAMYESGKKFVKEWCKNHPIYK